MQLNTSHRQPGDAHDHAGNAGEDARTGEGRLSNAALVTGPKLLHFGLDYLRVCLGDSPNEDSRSIRFFRAIFSMPHNDSNASFFKDFVWADTDEDVDIHFGPTPNGEACYVSTDGWPIICIERLSEESALFKNIRGKYQFVISFYGDFFALFKSGLDPNTFWKIIDDDIENDAVVHTVSRIDICADFENIDVLKISKGISVKSPTHAKKFTSVKADWETRIPETFYYGNKTDKRWHARIYNKVKDIAFKRKEALFPNYWGLENITRLELELHEAGKEYGVDFMNCRDAEFQLSIVKSLLDSKYIYWKILPFLLSEMKKRGIEYFNLLRVQPDYAQMSNVKFYKRTLQKNLACIERMRIPLDLYLVQLTNDLREVLSQSDDA